MQRVDDLAEATAFLLRTYSGEEHVNIGTGADITNAELDELMDGYNGQMMEGGNETML